jgi:hypothetical protein
MNFGKCPGNPVNLSSKTAAKKYFDHLLTDKGFHILYHRPGSRNDKDSASVDHYEIITGEGTYDDLFIVTHGEMDIWVPPEGYLFDPKIELKRLDLPENNHMYLDESEISVERKYIREDKWPDDWQEILRIFHELPPLERYLYCSSGEDYYVENFPFPMIEDILDNLDVYLTPAMKKWIISGIEPRECGYRPV